jgi:1-acyl-sn-glycerol-3-phosphate acyltransferase
LYRFLRQLGTGAGFVTFLIGSSFWSWCLLPIVTFRTRGLPPIERIRAHQLAMMGGYRFFMKCLVLFRVCDFDRPDPPERPDGAFMLVANHPSLIDVMAILATVPNVCVVVRRGLFDMPFLGPLLRRCGHITGPEVGTDEGETPILDRIVERLESGLPVLIFPEGSRSPEWGLRRFKRGAVEAAVRAQVPILPVVVILDPSALRKDQPWHDVADRPFNLTVDFLPVMNPGSDSLALTRDLAATYRERVDSAKAASLAAGERR